VTETIFPVDIPSKTKELRSYTCAKTNTQYMYIIEERIRDLIQVFRIVKSFPTQ